MDTKENQSLLKNLFNPVNHALPYLSEENSLRYRRINFFTTSVLFHGIIRDKEETYGKYGILTENV
jgi:hypothetical protein